ncbi:MAG TPA: FG-GAP-like repeat-containing protein, partial [Bacteroidales bacterium]|nr:FG-GAP-like repeat-containing protein [Bacteroidales bacterium]
MKTVIRKTALLLIVISVTILFAGMSNVAAQYCSPTSNPASGTNINKVVLEEISYEHLWVSGDPGYNDYTQYYQCLTNLRRGQSYTITLTRGTYYSSMQYAAWIDYNNDGDFTDAGEKLGQSGTTSTSTTVLIPFTVPSGSPSLSTRLRIRSTYNIATLDPCANYTWGETEDYLIGITDFIRVTTGLDGGSGNLSFFDYDADNDYDLVVQDEYSSPALFFCSNTSGAYSFSNFLSTALPEPDNDNLSFNVCDLNNDNAPDLLLTYRYISGTEYPRTLYYQKQTAFTEVPTGMANLMRGSSAAADFNNDGRQDVVICGQDINHVPRTYIYKNTPSGFVLVNDKLHGIYGKVLATDYDNDDDYDIFLCGTDNYGNKFTTIYRNDNNWNFTNTQIDLYKTSWPNTQSAFGDFNNDGLADLFIYNKVYRNDGNGIFTPVTIDCPDFYSCSSWNDMDNDGSPDLIGLSATGIVILKFNGTDTFTVFQQIYSFKSGWDVGCSTGDFNNDRKQDIIMNYYDELYLFKNLTSVNNSAPSAPASLRSVVGKAGYYTVTFLWDNGSDDHTPPAGLSYNLRVGTAPGSNNIMSSMSSPVSPYTLMNPGIGNVGFNKSWTLGDLAPGTYYWSVQTIDKSGVASAFYADQKFIVEPPFTTTAFDIDGSITSAGAGADFDGDNDMDLLIRYGGLNIYQQTAPLNYAPQLVGYTYEPIEIRDLNNDNLPDIIAKHNKVNPPETVDSLVLFINQPNLKFKLVALDTATFYSSAAGDFDNDGDIDILVHHYGYYLYENTGPLQYTRIKLEIPGILDQYPTVSAIDIDADNDLDFVISGSKGNPYNTCHTFVFRNNGNYDFSLSQELSPGLGFTTFSPRAPGHISLPPDIVWNDYNLDGFPDLMITGRDSYNNVNNIIYLNDGTGIFSITEISPRPTDKFNTSWIDFNRDGTVDIIMPKLGLQVDNSIYLNNSNSSYTPFPNILDDRTDACYIGVTDIDKDNDKDIVLTYRVLTPPENYKYRTTILKNTFNFNNSPPQPPSSIAASIDNFIVHLSWTPGTDFLMGKSGFTYNIWVGTSPTTADVISPMSNLSTGYRFVEKLGNMGTNTTWTLKNLPLGRYYWGVQTIDNSLQGSAWSTMGTFEITALTADFSNDV